MRKAKVLFEYEPQEDDELGLKVGDIITDIENADVGWCSGALNGRRGVFPDNFVEMFEEEEKRAPPPPAASKKPSSKKKVRKMKVKFPYLAENVDELSLEAGEIIEILNDVEDGWAGGINKKGKKGVFPTNFGEIFEESEGETVTKQDQVAEHKVNEEVAPKKVKGVGFGDIFGAGPITLRQRPPKDSEKVTSPKAASSKEKTKEVTPVKPKEVSTPTKPSESKKARNYCKVLFDYARDNDDELDLRTGEVILIVDKIIADDGWWEGEKTLESGKRIRGVFPDNFVAELSSEEAKEYERSIQSKVESQEVTKASKPSKEVKKEMIPPQNSKPTTPVADKTDAADPAFMEASSSSHVLSQIKRPGGPKNRRKPGASERREKAATAESESTRVESEPESDPEPVVKKKESVKRGVAVLPGMSGDAPSGETPSWLQNLKNRQSVKRPILPPAKETEPPAWLAGLKKRQSTETVVTGQKPASKAPLQPPADKAATIGASPTSPASEKSLSSWQIERQQKTLKPKPAADINELQNVFGSLRRRKVKAPEPPHPGPEAPRKNSANKKPTTPIESPAPAKKPEKPAPPTTVPPKMKPPPPKAKPAPAAKPASSTAVEELKNEVKMLKEDMAKLKEEFKDEVSRLSSELKTEMAHRILLEDEVRKLRLSS